MENGEKRLLDWIYGERAGRWQSDYLANGRQEILQQFVHQCIIPNASAVVFRRDLALRTGLADEDFKLCGDWLFWIKLLVLCDIAYVAEPLNYWREHGNTVRAKSQDRGVEFEERHRILNYLEDRIRLDSEVIKAARADLWRSVLQWVDRHEARIQAQEARIQAHETRIQRQEIRTQVLQETNQRMRAFLPIRILLRLRRLMAKDLSRSHGFAQKNIKS
jgi:hypothetical protein